MLGNYLQQTTSADDIFRCIFFLGALRVNTHSASFNGLHVQMSKTNCMMISFTPEILNLTKSGKMIYSQPSL